MVVEIKRLFLSLLKAIIKEIRFSGLSPPSVGTTLSGENSLPPPWSSRLPLHVAMVGAKQKKKSRPSFALSFKVSGLMRSARLLALAKKKNKSFATVDFSDLGVAASGSAIPATSSSLSAFPSPPVPAPVVSPRSTADSGSLIKGLAPSSLKFPCPSLVEAFNLCGGSPAANNDSKPSEIGDGQVRNYAALLKSSAQLQEMGTPVEHVTGVPFVLIPDENIEAAKQEFKDFIYARFHGDYPSMGKIIGVVNAVWAKTGPRIFVHNLGQGTYLLRVTNQRSREALLSRTCWNIGGLPMFVAPWSPEYSPDEPPLTSAVVPVELRNVPYLLFNQESLSRLATAVGKPDSLAPETERKENFEVAKLYVRVDLTAPLPNKIVSGFSNGKEVQIDVSYPWLPVKCDACKKFGHTKERCPGGIADGSLNQFKSRKPAPEGPRRRSKSRPGRSLEKNGKKLESYYVPVVRDSQDAPKLIVLEEGEIGQEISDRVGLNVSNLNLISDTHQNSELDEIPTVAEDLVTGGGVFQKENIQHGEALPAASDKTDVQELTLPTRTKDKEEMSLEEGLPSADGLVSKVDDNRPNSNPPDGKNQPSESLTPCGHSTEQCGSASDISPAEDSQDKPQTEEELDRDNPFILVRNRKCGRRAMRRH